MKYQKKTGMSLFEQENTLESLSKIGNPLVILKEIVDFELFRDELEKLFTNNSKKNNAERKPIDPVFMLKTRCRIEHVYGFMEQSMKGLFFRGVGMVRAAFYIGFTNLVYNMCRLVQIKRYHPDWIFEI